MVLTKAVPLSFAVVMTFLFARVSSYESPQRVRLREGEPADFSFQVDFEPDADIQIRIGKQRPFYKFKKIHEDGLRESQKERFSVEVEDNEPYHMISVHVIISSVSREDEGTFICDLLLNGESTLDHPKKLGVSVDFPPGNASCRQENHHIDNSNDVWALMKCSAAAGRDHGIIECYQHGERMPPYATPANGETNLTQIIWMRKSSHIYCCASISDKPKGMCNCHDFVYDPAASKEIKSWADPCKESLKISSSTESPSTMSKESTTTTEESLTECNDGSSYHGREECNVDCCSERNMTRINFMLILINTFFLLIILGMVVVVIPEIVKKKK